MKQSRRYSNFSWVELSVTAICLGFNTRKRKWPTPDGGHDSFGPWLKLQLQPTITVTAKTTLWVIDAGAI